MEEPEGSFDIGRRRALGGSVLAGMAVAVGVPTDADAATATATAAATATPQAATSLSKAERDAMTPDGVIEAMLAGNARFLSGARRNRDFLAEMHDTAAGQYPAAVVLSCIDSRAAVEVICDLGIGDTFNARVAGNAVNDDILGSMEYSCAVSGAKLVVVMGHTSCGAIKGAIDNVTLGNLTLLLARFKSAIAETPETGERTTANHAFVDAVAQTHVKQTVALVRARSPVLAALEADGRIKIIGAMYDLESGRIRLL
jgi:carbonic anhydrase